MARKPRIYFPGALYHVMLRGNDGMKIFFLDKDRNYFLFLCEEGIKRYQYEIHSYCLMNNHVHILLRIGNTSLSKVIHNISFRYTQWINKRQQRTGHLFQGRYKAILVDEESYLLQLVRYIHLNPTRAKLIDKIDDYRWSSHRIYLGWEQSRWLSTDWVLSHFSDKRLIAVSRYHQFITKRDDYHSPEFQRGNQPGYDILAEDDFMEKIRVDENEEIKHINLEKLINLVCDYYQVNASILKSNLRTRLYSRMRAFIAILSQEFAQCTFTSLAAYFNRDVSGVVRSIRQVREDTDASNELNILRKLIEKSTSQA